MIFLVVVYIFETYLDIRQRVKLMEEEVPTALKDFVSKVCSSLCAPSCSSASLRDAPLMQSKKLLEKKEQRYLSKECARGNGLLMYPHLRQRLRAHAHNDCVCCICAYLPPVCLLALTSVRMIPAQARVRL